MYECTIHKTVLAVIILHKTNKQHLRLIQMFSGLSCIRQTPVGGTEAPLWPHSPGKKVDSVSPNSGKGRGCERCPSSLSPASKHGVLFIADLHSLVLFSAASLSSLMKFPWQRERQYPCESPISPSFSSSALARSLTSGWRSSCRMRDVDALAVVEWAAKINSIAVSWNAFSFIYLQTWIQMKLKGKKLNANNWA